MSSSSTGADNDNDAATPALFRPTTVGGLALQHRVVLAPLTRNRANAQHVHGALAVEYYAQRASVRGTLLISEAITIVPEGGGRPHVPGIWSEEQVEAWQRVCTLGRGCGCEYRC